MGKILNQQQIEQYHAQGYVAPIEVLSQKQAQQYADKLYQAEQQYPAALNAENRNNAHLCFSFLDELAFHPIILDAVEDLIGAHFALWGSVLFIKEPQSKHYVSWHQDATYMGITPGDFVTPWLALSPSNRQTGCMSMLPGSHKKGIHPHQDTFSADNILTRGQQVPNIDTAKAVDLLLEAGQMSLHHAATVHGSQVNRSTERRIGFALQSFMPAGAQQTIGENYWQHARGMANKEYHYFTRPAGDMQQAAIATRNQANKNWANVLYHGAAQRRAY